MLACHGFPQGISPSRKDPGYWSYGGKTVVLAGGWDHGHNPFLDHSTIDGGGYMDSSTKEEIIAALDLLASCGGNLLRCVLDPGVAAGQGFPICRVVDGKYDLDHMEGLFWERLEWFVTEAEQREIIIGMEIWDRFDWYDGGHEGWPVSPFNPDNNINYTRESSGLSGHYTGKGDQSENPFGQTVPGQRHYDAASPPDRIRKDLLRGYQEAFMNKLLSITLRYGNVLYSANNEVRHQEPAWGLYWLDFIRKQAAESGVDVYCTDMFWDILDIPDSPGFDFLLANVNKYDYFDVSQTSAHRGNQGLTVEEAGEIHWGKIRYAVEKGRAVNRILHMDKIYGSSDREGTWMGSARNAVEEFWRSLIAGVAGVRFHRPESGIGISPLAQASIRTVRLVEQQVKLWDLEPRMDLLSKREPNEAYLAADPGNAYLVFLPDGGEVGVDLSAYHGRSYQLTWLDISKGEISKQSTLSSGQVGMLSVPEKGPWLAVMVRPEGR